MPDFGLPTADADAVRLFRASHLSLDPSTADFSLRRVVPISIFVEGDADRAGEVGEILSNEFKQVMEEAGYAPDGEWGPFQGSFFTTIFGKGRDRKKGKSFQKDIAQLAERFRKVAQGISPQLLAGLHVVVVVGTTVVHIVGVGAVAAALPVAVPVAVIECVLHVAEAAEVVDAIRHALEVRKHSSKQSGDFEL